MPKFVVPIYYSGLANYIVEADNEMSAKMQAELKFFNGEPEDILGNEFEEIDKIGNVEKV